MSIDRWRFRELNPAVGRLIQSWVDRAREGVGCADEEAFEPFIYCYIAFNAWGATITCQERDAEIIRLIGEHPPFCSTFDALRKTEKAFDTAAEAFRGQWPIIKASALRRFGVSLPPRGSAERADAIRALNCQIEVAPARRNGERPRIGAEYELDWPSTLAAIYRVRCNLFHGEKQATSEDDARIVGAAFRVLFATFDRLLH